MDYTEWMDMKLGWPEPGSAH